MKFLLQVFLIATAAWLAELVFPWWTVAIAALIVTSLWPNTGFKSFLSGFLGVGGLWLIAAMYFSIRTDYILTEKVADLMELGRSGVLIVVTSLIGGIAGGMGALTGSQLRRLLKSERATKSRYHSSF